MKSVYNKVPFTSADVNLPDRREEELQYLHHIDLGFSIPLHNLSKWQLDYMVKTLGVTDMFSGKVNTHISYNGRWFYSPPIDVDNPLFNHSFNEVFI